jgi:hypothetical protein
MGEWCDGCEGYGRGMGERHLKRTWGIVTYLHVHTAVLPVVPSVWGKHWGEYKSPRVACVRVDVASPILRPCPCARDFEKTLLRNLNVKF